MANEYSLGVPGEVFAFSQCQNKVTVAEAQLGTALMAASDSSATWHLVYNVNFTWRAAGITSRYRSYIG